MHEMTHVFGFSIENFGWFINPETGYPWEF